MIVADSPYIAGDRKRGPIEHAHRVRQGFTRRHLAELFRDKGYTTGAEIGVADGRYSLTLCETIPNLRLFCVDPWEPYAGNRRGGPIEQHERNYQLAQTRMAPFDATLLRMKSARAAREVADGSLDFVYIDGNHAQEYVWLDLNAWEPKVRSGGIVAGHDFYEFNGAGVIEAVVDFTKTNGISEWHLCDEREPSFYWVKS
jgi:predicted O-methyltransferase YrrM